MIAFVCAHIACVYIIASARPITVLDTSTTMSMLWIVRWPRVAPSLTHHQRQNINLQLTRQTLSNCSDNNSFAYFVLRRAVNWCMPFSPCFQPLFFKFWQIQRSNPSTHTRHDTVYYFSEWSKWKTKQKKRGWICLVNPFQTKYPI